jgi:hypothetical protein
VNLGVTTTAVGAVGQLSVVGSYVMVTDPSPAAARPEVGFVAVLIRNEEPPPPPLPGKMVSDPPAPPP